MGRGNSMTLRKRGALSIDAQRAPAPAEAESEGWAAPAQDDDDEQPVSPTGRLFREPHFDCYIVCVLGAGCPIDLAAVRPGLEATLARHPRFCSVQVQALSKMMESGGKDDGARWGNRLGFMMIPFDLATHDDPLEYVRRGAEVARRKKSSLECVLTYWTAIAVDKLLGIKAAASLCYKMFTHTTLLFSNTVGPIERVVLCGHPIVYIAPAVYGLPKALSVHYQSYVNTMKLVIAVNAAQFPDLYKLLEDFAESLRLIRAATAASREESS